jgi:hypothetical protein
VPGPPAVVRLLADTQPSADIGHGRALPKVDISLPKQAHDLLCTASLLHPRTLSSPTRGTRILSQDLGQDLGRGSILNDDFVEPTIAAIVKGGRTGDRGEIGDGKIFVLPMDECVRIRTGERGHEAI